MPESSIFPEWLSTRRMPLVMQTEAAECALACLTMISCYFGHEIDLAAMRRRFSTSLKGVNLARMVEIADALGLDARPLRAELEYLPDAQLPCILHWNLNHFVVLQKIKGKEAVIFDPAVGRYQITIDRLSDHFTGIVLELKPGADFAPVRERRAVSLRSLTGRITGLMPVLVQVIGLAFAIEILALVLPFQIQLVVDQVILSSDKGLLVVVSIAFLLVILLQTVLVVIRGWVISWLGASLNSQWATNLFGHLLKLPLEYFEKRHIGDVVSRFSSVQFIQQTFTGSFVEALLDGLVGILSLIILSAYSLKLTGLVVLACTLYVALRWAFYRTLWRINEEQLIYGAKQQSELMESVRGVQTIKLANKQVERKNRLANATVESSIRSMKAQRLSLSFGAINRGLFGAQRVMVIALGAYLVIQGEFSAGMLVAFVAYADQFTGKFGSFVDRFVAFRMLRLHGERIADIALTAPEQHVQNSSFTGLIPESRIDVKGLSFRYAEGEPWIFQGLNMTIEAGESVAIVGPSGCGKSTLAKLLLGLLEPTEGVIQIGGMDIRHYGLENYRRIVGAVMQDDHLFAGSIADNISFFDESATMDQVVAAAGLAQMHEEIVAMPMGYESLVGDMGAALSGGQKQRIMLARAFFKNPRVLIMDEATSHLDGANEMKINEKIREINITRIIIAHRAETIASAGRMIRLDES
ncbi:MAG: peptidase domain-containing ABC transporter [Stenotrophomonas acidaminiphila]